MADSNEHPAPNLIDRVLQSQQSENLEQFDPLETINELLKQLSSKEADVLRRRFGLGQHEPETLEVIGHSYNVTRERVRQIQRWAVEHLKKSPATKSILHGLTLVLQQLLESHGGLLLEDDLLQHLRVGEHEPRASQASTIFLLEQLLDEKVERVESTETKPYWKLRFANVQWLKPTLQAAELVLNAAGKPLNQTELVDRLRSTDFVREHADQLPDATLLSYLNVATTIDRNPYGEYGLRSWGTIVPKRMHDKILLVLRKSGKPMHFQDIAQRINEIGFDHRKAYPPTVHNELILNNEYVLIGRGIYALREWGYKPGVVADVIAALLDESGEPLSRDEIVEKVLQQRMVKKNTIHLALTNKQRFQRLSDGRYTLAATKTNTNSSPAA